jgi:haloacetate dehalogenase
VIGGKGPAVLLLHGYLETHAAWHDVAPRLAEHHTVVAPDLPGCGRSVVADDGAWDKREVAAELVANREDQGEEAEIGAKAMRRMLGKGNGASPILRPQALEQAH